ncbi:hypothetical protein ABE10_10625 [Bacillus toyonensis]|nr:hypothetical protein [Bacillus toyonensis]
MAAVDGSHGSFLPAVHPTDDRRHGASAVNDDAAHLAVVIDLHRQERAVEEQPLRARWGGAIGWQGDGGAEAKRTLPDHVVGQAPHHQRGIRRDALWQVTAEVLSCGYMEDGRVNVRDHPCLGEHDRYFHPKRDGLDALPWFGVRATQIGQHRPVEDRNRLAFTEGAERDLAEIVRRRGDELDADVSACANREAVLHLVVRGVDGEFVARQERDGVVHPGDGRICGAAGVLVERSARGEQSAHEQLLIRVQRLDCLLRNVHQRNRAVSDSEPSARRVPLFRFGRGDGVEEPHEGFGRLMAKAQRFDGDLQTAVLGREVKGLAAIGEIEGGEEISLGFLGGDGRVSLRREERRDP